MIWGSTPGIGPVVRPVAVDVCWV